MEIMNINVNLIVNEDPQYEEILELVNHCDYCGTRLNFNYVPDYVTNTIEEESKCPSCKVKSNKNTFSIQ